MRCPKCRSPAVRQRPECTAQGYRRFRCLDCTKQFNERSAGRLNRTQYPSDVIALVVLWRFRYKLSLRDLPVLTAGPTADAAPWLMLPLGLGTLAVSGALLCDLRTIAPPRGNGSFADLAELAPVWLLLALVVLLAVAMPGPVVEWFRTLAAFR